jgi:type IV secretory pathway ATPase VirB11/archaellum biosynthesis ATPase
LGEIRSGEAFDLLQLLNTGHAGTLSTIRLVRRSAPDVLQANEIGLDKLYFGRVFYQQDAFIRGNEFSEGI